MKCPKPSPSSQPLRARLQQIEAQSGPKPTTDFDAATLSEVFAKTASDAAAPGFVLAHLPRDDRPILWIQDRLSQREAGRPYLAGLSHPPNLLCLTVSKPIDVLWAMEQGLSCTALAGVVGEVWGDAPALTFTASKRLALRAETHGVPAWLLRRAACTDLSAARERWHLTSAPSDSAPFDPRAPGSPRWKAELFRSRRQTPGTWVVTHDQGKIHFDTAAAPYQPATPEALQA